MGLAIAGQGGIGRDLIEWYIWRRGQVGCSDQKSELKLIGCLPHMSLNLRTHSLHPATPSPPSLYPTLNPHADLLFTAPSHWDWPVHRPAPPRKSKPAPSLKKEIVIWFNALTLEEKRAASAFQNPPFLQDFLAALPLRGPNALFSFSPLRVAAGQDGDDTCFQDMLPSVKVGWAGQGVVFLGEGVEGVVAWLEAVSGGRVFEAAGRGQAEENPLWFSSRAFHPLSKWLGKEMEMAIVRSYLGAPSPYEEVANLAEFLRKTGKANVGKGLEVGLEEWAEKEVGERDTMRERLRSAEEKLQKARQEELLLSFESRPKKSRRKHKRREAAIQQKQLQLILISREPVGCDSDNDSLPPQPPTPPAQLLTAAQTPCDKPDQHEENSTDEDRHTPTLPVSEKTEPEPLLEQQEEELSQNSTSLAESRAKTCRRSRAERRARKEEEAMRETTEVLFKRIVERQMEGLVDQLSADSNSQLPAKRVAFERVRVLVQSLFPYASALLFGSNAIGLALPTSDIDILLCGLPCSCREQSAAYLQRIGEQFSAMGWVVSCRVYAHAKVPVLKLEVDCGVEFLSTRGECAFAVYDPLLIAGLSGGGEARVRVDVSVNAEGGSAGYESTVLMRSWMERYPLLQKLLILFKYLLSLKALNENFRGGIGSYCLFVMLASYLHSHPSPPSLFATFQELVQFYLDFDNLGQVIWLQEERCFYPVEEVSGMGKAGLLRIIDPLTSQLMSSSCQEYERIRGELKRVTEGLREVEGVVGGEVRTVRERRGKEGVAGLLGKGGCGFVREFEQKYGNLARQIFEDSN